MSEEEITNLVFQNLSLRNAVALGVRQQAELRGERDALERENKLLKGGLAMCGPAALWPEIA